MHLVRAIKPSDFDLLMECARNTSIGITHLPMDERQLKDKLEGSITSFSKRVQKPDCEEYLFILDDLQTGQKGGTSGILACTGKPNPLHVFKIDQLPKLPEPLKRPSEQRTLILKKYDAGPSEICGLYLLPNFRHSGLGKLLSLSRLLFIASFPERFHSFLIANMRGVIENDTSLFWEHIGRHFLDYDLKEVMKIRLNYPLLAEQIFPNYPLNVSMIPPSVRDLIGAVHAHSQPAYQMLYQQGMKFINEIDPYDGGPLVGSSIQDIHGIKNARIGIFTGVNEKSEGFKAIISNGKLNFKACYGMVVMNGQDVKINKETAEALELSSGDHIRYI